MPGLEFLDIHKSFGAVRALDGVTLDVRSGETHALMGENGAGKSTLLKILAGIVAPDRGEIKLDDRRLALSGPRDALVHGIGMVFQEMVTFPNLTVTGNIFAGREDSGGEQYRCRGFARPKPGLSPREIHRGLPPGKPPCPLVT